MRMIITSGGENGIAEDQRDEIGRDGGRDRTRRVPDDLGMRPIGFTIECEWRIGRIERAARGSNAE